MRFQTPAPSRARTAPPIDVHRTLIVDHDVHRGRITVCALSPADTTWVLESHDAMTALAEDEPDLVVIGVTDGHGRDALIEHVAATYPNLPLLVLSDRPARTPFCNLVAPHACACDSAWCRHVISAAARNIAGPVCDWSAHGARRR
jgi:hypothetical protein